MEASNKRTIVTIKMTCSVGLREVNDFNKISFVGISETPDLNLEPWKEEF